MPGVIIDIGTGDGEFVYKVAKENPDRFVIGIEPHHKGLERVSAKIDKKSTKGGLKNALFVLGSIEELPEELDGTANQVFINFPWARLLKGLLMAEKPTWDAIGRITKKGAIIDILLTYDKSTEETEFRKVGLPDISLSYLQNVTAPHLKEKGFKTLEIREVDNKELKRYPSSWAKKLSYGRERKYYYMRLKEEKA